MVKIYIIIAILYKFLILAHSQTAPKIVDPFHLEQIEGLVLYEKSGHVQFTVSTYLTTSSPIFTAEPIPACSSVSAGPTCWLIYYLGLVEKEIRSMVTTEQTQRKDESLQASLTPNCEEIFQIFPSLYTDNDIFNASGLNALSKCINGTVINEAIDYSSSFTSYYSDSMREFAVNYTNAVGLNNTVAAMGNMVVQEVLNVAGFLHHFAYKTRWEDAVSKCKLQKVLPPSLVTTEILKKVLTEYEAAAQKKGYDFALPINNQSISAYWTIPTVDCTFSSSSAKLNILMGVPLKKAGGDLSLHKLTVVPFHRSFMNVSYICYASEAQEDEQFFKFDKTTETASKSDGEHSSFLKYSPSAKPRGFLQPVSQTLSCAKTVISGGGNADPLDIVRNCQLTCALENSIEDNGDGIIVQMISSDQFYVTKAREGINQVVLECGGRNGTAVLPADGALFVTAGCGCKLNLKEMMYEVGIPCAETGGFTAQEVIPVHFQTAFDKSIAYMN